jgi:hypothetical protein
MPGALQLVPPIPSLAAAVERFLSCSRFAARTHESYGQNLASPLARVGEQPVTSLGGVHLAAINIRCHFDDRASGGEPGGRRSC